MLYNFTLTQLLKHNIHLGSQTRYWNRLNKELVSGIRQFYFILNCNLTIVNLRRSFLLIASLFRKQLLTLFYHYDLNFKSFFCDNIKFFNLLQLRLTLGRWMPGFLTNFKIYYNFVLRKLIFVFKLLKIKRFREWFIRRFHKFWFFFLLLKSHKIFSAAIFSFNSNQWVVAESRNILIPSIIMMDTSSLEQVINQTTFLIPFNFFNLNSLLFLIICLNKLYLKNIIQSKMFFFVILMNLLKDKSLIKFFSNLKFFNYGFTLLSNCYRHNLLFIRTRGINYSVLFYIYIRLVMCKLVRNYHYI